VVRDHNGGIDANNGNDGDEKYAEQSHGSAPETGAFS
jgi:hypothetical protein